MSQEGTVESGAGPGELADRQATTGPGPARPPSRREIVARKQAQARRNRPFILAGFLIFVAILALPVYGFVNEFVLPHGETAVRVNDRVYTRGDVVDFVRFHQRLALEGGNEFNTSEQLLTAIETISENEIAYQKAPVLGITVSELEVDGAIRETLGFRGMSASEAAKPDVKADIEEAFRQLLIRTQLSEESYRDIVRKGLFREKARRSLRQEVPRLQPQKRVYVMEFPRETDPRIDRARKRLATGDDIRQVVVDLSAGPQVARTRGDLGWMPNSVLDNQDVEDLIFGVNERGEPNLQPGNLSQGLWNGTDAVYRYYYIDEVSAARELDPEDLETLADKSLKVWLEDQRLTIDDYRLVFNSEIFAWVSDQVNASRIETAEPTPAPGAPIDLTDFVQGAN